MRNTKKRNKANQDNTTQSKAIQYKDGRSMELHWISLELHWIVNESYCWDQAEA